MVLLHHITASLEGVDYTASLTATGGKVLLKIAGIFAHIMKQTSQISRFFKPNRPQTLCRTLRRPDQMIPYRLPGNFAVRHFAFMCIKSYQYHPPRFPVYVSSVLPLPLYFAGYPINRTCRPSFYIRAPNSIHGSAEAGQADDIQFQIISTKRKICARPIKVQMLPFAFSSHKLQTAFYSLGTAV